MDTSHLLDIALRWMHIFAAVTAAGGTFFCRLALAPAVAELPADAREALHAGVRRRWMPVLNAAILFLLVSGLFNFMRSINEFNLPKYYHPLFGVKFLAAMAVFFLGTLLVGKSENARRYQQRARYWLTVNSLLLIVIIGISGVLRMAPREPKKAAVPDVVAPAAAAVGGDKAPS